MSRTADCTLAPQSSKSRYSTIVDAISGKYDLQKTTKIDQKLIRVRISIRPNTILHFFRFGGRLGIDCGRPGTARNSPRRPFSAPRRILEASRASPGIPLGHFRGVPGTLRYAPGAPGDIPRRSETLPRRPWDTLGAPRGRSETPE